jgi:hypothetical protein
MRRVAQIVFPVLALGLSLSLTRCGGESTTGSSTTGACSNGICGSGGETTSGGTMTTTGGMGGSPTTGASMTTTGGMGGTPNMTTTGGMGGAPGTTTTTAGVTSSSGATTGSGGCVESWLCTPWDGKGTNAGTRVCTDTNNCGTMANKPATTATLPALDKSFFECDVEPILDAKCSMMGCHGTETGRALRVYSRGKLRDASVPLANTPPPPNNCTPTLLSACIGTNDCHCAGPHAAQEWDRNFDAARGMMLDVNGNLIPAAQVATSDLLAQPVVGGKSHAGVHLFKLNDAEYTVIKNWLTGSTDAGCSPLPN